MLHIYIYIYVYIYIYIYIYDISRLRVNAVCYENHAKHKHTAWEKGRVIHYWNQWCIHVVSAVPWRVSHCNRSVYTVKREICCRPVTIGATAPIKHVMCAAGSISLGVGCCHYWSIKSLIADYSEYNSTALRLLCCISVFFFFSSFASHSTCCLSFLILLSSHTFLPFCFSIYFSSGAVLTDRRP